MSLLQFSQICPQDTWVCVPRSSGSFFSCFVSNTVQRVHDCRPTDIECLTARGHHRHPQSHHAANHLGSVAVHPCNAGPLMRKVARMLSPVSCLSSAMRAKLTESSRRDPVWYGWYSKHCTWSQYMLTRLPVLGLACRKRHI